MTRDDTPLSSRTLAAFLEGEVTQSEAEQIVAKLRDCAISRRRLERVRKLRLGLSKLPDELDGVDLVAGVRYAISSAPPAARVRAAHRIWWSSAAVVGLVAILALVLWPRGPHGMGSEASRDKAVGNETQAPDRWIGIKVFRIVTGLAQPVTDGGTIQTTDRLVFRYNNLGSEPFNYLMIFGIDAARDIHWYYPAYVDAGSNPSSLAIRSGEIRVALPDAVQHELPVGPLVIYGVFSREPLRVLDIENRIAAMIAGNGWDPAAPPRVPVASSGQEAICVNVMR
jgi:hypothetical protein